MSARPRNHEDLPILEEIGRDLSTAFHREERAEAARRGRRRLRKVAAATVALFVIVPSSVVVATRYIWAPDPGAIAPSRPFESSRPIRIAEGRGDVVQWRISAYMSENGVCHQMTTFTATESGGTGGGLCADQLPADHLDIRSSSAFGETVISGTIDPRVARVEVQATGQPREQAQIVTTPPETAERARLPKDLRFYVATVRGEDFPGPRSGFRVVAFDAGGRELAREEIGNVSGRASR